jgi:hypothetical protein
MRCPVYLAAAATSLLLFGASALATNDTNGPNVQSSTAVAGSIVTRLSAGDDYHIRLMIVTDPESRIYSVIVDNANKSLVQCTDHDLSQCPSAKVEVDNLTHPTRLLKKACF